MMEASRALRLASRHICNRNLKVRVKVNRRCLRVYRRLELTSYLQHHKANHIEVIKVNRVNQVNQVEKWDVQLLHHSGVYQI